MVRFSFRKKLLEGEKVLVQTTDAHGRLLGVLRCVVTLQFLVFARVVHFMRICCVVCKGSLILTLMTTSTQVSLYPRRTEEKSSSLSSLLRDAWFVSVISRDIARLHSTQLHMARPGGNFSCYQYMFICIENNWPHTCNLNVNIVEKGFHITSPFWALYKLDLLTYYIIKNYIW